jgi:hypothetical protein
LAGTTAAGELLAARGVGIAGVCGQCWAHCERDEKGCGVAGDGGW